MAGQRVYEAFIPIPSDNNILTPQWQLPQGAEKGSPIVFHLHNHGVNTWNLLSINAVPE
jgi:hypothetical protein